nr:hypothetical protein [Tanacetum cinerariifolium]
MSCLNWSIHRTNYLTLGMVLGLFPPPPAAPYPTIFNPLVHYQTNPLALLSFPHHQYTLAIPGYPIGYKETTPTMKGPDYIQPEDTKMEGFDHLLEPHTEVAQET